jgi:hypothetical protein
LLTCAGDAQRAHCSLFAALVELGLLLGMDGGLCLAMGWFLLGSFGLFGSLGWILGSLNLILGNCEFWGNCEFNFKEVFKSREFCLTKNFKEREFWGNFMNFEKGTFLTTNICIFFTVNQNCSSLTIKNCSLFWITNIFGEFIH